MSDTKSLTTESLNVFLATVKAELDSYKRFMELHAPQLAPGFNMVNCFNPNENRLSAVIAMLLDPNGGHGQGALFLKTFLNVLTEDLPKDNLVAVKISNIQEMSDHFLQNISETPALEVATSLIQESQRRIDILLHFNVPRTNGFGIAIENKPWACDQDDQLTAYDNHLRCKYSEDSFVQIYLSGSGELPEENSISRGEWNTLEQEKGRLIMMTYRQLKIWCVISAEKCKAPRLRYFIEDFADYIYDNFEGGTDVIEDKIVAELAAKAENIASTIAISNAWPTVAHMLIKELAEKAMKSAGLSPDWKLNVDFELSEGKGFEIYKEDWKTYSIKFAFGTGNARDFLFGICTRGVKKIYPEDVYEQLNAAFGKGDQPNDWWTWSKYFDDPYRNWHNNDKLWSDIKKDGEIIKHVADKLTKFTSISIDQFEQQLDL